MYGGGGGEEGCNTSQVPECNVDAAEGGHEDCTTAVETLSPDGLPDLLYITAMTVNTSLPFISRWCE